MIDSTPTRWFSVSMPDDDLRAFADAQADAFFGGNRSAYVQSLIDGDRQDGLTARRMLARAIELIDGEDAA